MTVRYRAVLFDLLTGLLDSWSLWNSVAGDAANGQRWRHEYLRLTYATGDYRPYEDLVAEAAVAQGLPPGLADRLAVRWDELEPWPEATGVVAELARSTKVGVVTNCSEELGRRAAARLGVPLDAVVTAEQAGAYKPRPEPYLLGLQALDVPAEQTLFVAGSRFDLPGAGGVGMDVWWHNRTGAPLDDSARPFATRASLSSLPGDVVGGGG